MCNQIFKFKKYVANPRLLKEMWISNKHTEAAYSKISKTYGKENKKHD